MAMPSEKQLVDVQSNCATTLLFVAGCASGALWLTLSVDVSVLGLGATDGAADGDAMAMGVNKLMRQYNGVRLNTIGIRRRHIVERRRQRRLNYVLVSTYHS